MWPSDQVFRTFLSHLRRRDSPRLRLRQNLLAFEREVETHPEVVECYTMAGIWDYVLKIICKDVRHYEDFVRNTLLSGDLVREMHSHIAVTEIKNTTELPIATQL